MGIGGVLKAHFIGSIAVKTFWLGPTFVTLAMLIVGGQRSLTGAVVGVVTVAALLEFLRQLEAGLPLGDMVVQSPRYMRELGIALVMLVILIVRPSGITMGREIPWPFGAGAGRRGARGRAGPAATSAGGRAGRGRGTAGGARHCRQLRGPRRRRRGFARPRQARDSGPDRPQRRG